MTKTAYAAPMVVEHSTLVFETKQSGKHKPKKPKNPNFPWDKH